MKFYREAICMNAISLDYQKAKNFFSQDEIDNMAGMVKSCHDMLHAKSGAGNDFLGWLELPENYDKAEFDRIKKAAEKIKSDSDVLHVVGIGGSYLGARAVIEARLRA